MIQPIPIKFNEEDLDKIKKYLKKELQQKNNDFKEFKDTIKYLNEKISSEVGEIGNSALEFIYSQEGLREEFEDWFNHKNKIEVKRKKLEYVG